jgi:hypothetical protein
MTDEKQTDDLHKADTTQLISDIKICLWRHLAAKTTSGLKLQKSPETRER